MHVYITEYSRHSTKLFLQSSELEPPPPHPQATVPLPPHDSCGGTHLLGGEGVGGPYSGEGTGTI
jgi:hypothetical protein